MSNFSPREIVSELDKYIIGQDDAKKAVAVALRNRWRRMQLPDRLKEEIVPKNILMIGGGLVGCETALHLQKTGYNVLVVEMLDRIAKDSYGMYREALLLEMEKCGVSYLVNATCKGICEDGAIIAQNGALRKLEADTVLYALGMRPNDSHQLKQAAGNIPIYVIGDCLTPGKVGDAMKAAYELALTL